MIMRSFRSAYEEAAKKLQEQDIPDAKLDAWYLLEQVSGLTRAEYFLHQEEEMEEEAYIELERLLKLRMNHIPLQQITGNQEFMGLPFRVNEHVLIPRQDTEILVEEVLKVSKDKSVLDMCTGSGCIIISIAKLGKIKAAVAADISTEALLVAKENARENEAPVQFVKSDMFEEIHQAFDIIVSNPPYIKTAEIQKLMPEVKEHEPYIALDGDTDGLKFYRIIAEKAGEFLNKDGYLFLEIGYDQGEAVKELLSLNGFNDIRILKDLAGLDRVISAKHY